MKKVFLSMAAFALVMASCSKEEVPGTTNPDGVTNAVAIQLTQTVKGLSTKAPVAAGQSIAATVVMHDTSDGTAKWSTFSPVTANTVNDAGAFAKDGDRATISKATFNATSATEGATVTLAPPLYYPTSNHSHLAAVSPNGKVENQTVVMGTVDGMQDVMYAKTIDAGTATNHTSMGKLEFEHLTTQLNFKVKLTAASSNAAWGGKASVKSITIIDALLPQAVNFATGAPVWTDKALFTVPGINMVALTSTEKATGNSVMIQEAGLLKLNVVIVGGDNKEYEFNDVVVKKDASNNLTTVTGKSHEITLNVTEPSKAGDSVTEITTSAIVKDWVPGDKGSADLK